MRRSPRDTRATKSEPTPRVEPRSRTPMRHQTPMRDPNARNRLRPTSLASGRTPSQAHSRLPRSPNLSPNSGPTEAVRRAEAELRSAKRARSRTLHALWSAVLARIDHGRNEDAIGAKRATGRRPFGPRPRRQSHEGLAEATPAVISLASTPGPSRPVITPELAASANAPRAAKSARTGMIQPVRVPGSVAGRCQSRPRTPVRRQEGPAQQIGEGASDLDGRAAEAARPDRRTRDERPNESARGASTALSEKSPRPTTAIRSRVSALPAATRQTSSTM